MYVRTVVLLYYRLCHNELGRLVDTPTWGSHHRDQDHGRVGAAILDGDIDICGGGLAGIWGPGFPNVVRGAAERTDVQAAR